MLGLNELHSCISYRLTQSNFYAAIGHHQHAITINRNIGHDSTAHKELRLTLMELTALIASMDLKELPKNDSNRSSSSRYRPNDRST